MPKKPNSKPGETKSAIVRRLLARKAGADIATLQTATGWQAHSVRAALSKFRKAGFTIDKMPAGSSSGKTSYRLTKSPEET